MYSQCAALKNEYGGPTDTLQGDIVHLLHRAGVGTVLTEDQRAYPEQPVDSQITSGQARDILRRVELPARDAVLAAGDAASATKQQ